MTENHVIKVFLARKTAPAEMRATK